jgi:hypothetical protein
MERLTDAARRALHALDLDPARERRVSEIAARMACAEILPAHIELGIVIDRARRDSDLEPAA